MHRRRRSGAGCKPRDTATESGGAHEIESRACDVTCDMRKCHGDIRRKAYSTYDQMRNCTGHVQGKEWDGEIKETQRGARKGGREKEGECDVLGREKMTEKGEGVGRERER